MINYTEKLNISDFGRQYLFYVTNQVKAIADVSRCDSTWFVVDYVLGFYFLLKLIWLCSWTFSAFGARRGGTLSSERNMSSVSSITEMYYFSCVHFYFI